MQNTLITIALLLLLIPIGGVVQCIFAPSARTRWMQYLRECLVAWDRLINAHIPPFITLSYADETMSARIWRAARRGRIVGRTLRPCVDFLFSWQAADPKFSDYTGAPIRSHCHRAYLKEKQKFYLPPEYREQQEPNGRKD